MKSRGMRVEAPPTICRRCGSNDVAWVQSKKGKFYLVEKGFVDPSLKSQGLLVWNKTTFHKCVPSAKVA
jgi:hypothetical protein